MSGVLHMWTVYENPSDHPGQFVVRRFSITEGHVEADAFPTAVAPSLAKAREFIPPGRCMIPRSVGDDPVIVEVWL